MPFALACPICVGPTQLEPIGETACRLAHHWLCVCTAGSEPARANLKLNPSPNPPLDGPKWSPLASGNDQAPLLSLPSGPSPAGRNAPPPIEHLGRGPKFKHNTRQPKHDHAHLQPRSEWAPIELPARMAGRSSKPFWCNPIALECAQLAALSDTKTSSMAARTWARL